ncbi:MAG: hypothetical protein LBL90_10020 [Prevotellaceae bacterium]|nr:hypothetical protein [Prevotellaceae bacterium]
MKTFQCSPCTNNFASRTLFAVSVYLRVSANGGMERNFYFHSTKTQIHSLIVKVLTATSFLRYPIYRMYRPSFFCRFRISSGFGNRGNGA